MLASIFFNFCSPTLFLPFFFLMQGLVKPRLALEFALWQAMIFLPLLRIRTKFFSYLLIRGQRTTYQSFFFFLQSYGSWESNSDCKTWQQASSLLNHVVRPQFFSFLFFFKHSNPTES